MRKVLCERCLCVYLFSISMLVNIFPEILRSHHHRPSPRLSEGSDVQVVASLSHDTCLCRLFTLEALYSW